MRGQRIPDATRAAVIAALLEGQATTAVARDYKIPESSVRRIKKDVPKDKLAEVGVKKEIDIAEHIAKFLDASFEAMLNILAVTRNDAWLSKQPASELATFNGVTADKVFRVLEAIDAASQTATDARGADA